MRFFFIGVVRVFFGVFCLKVVVLCVCVCVWGGGVKVFSFTLIADSRLL